MQEKDRTVSFEVCCWAGERLLLRHIVFSWRLGHWRRPCPKLRAWGLPVVPGLSAFCHEPLRASFKIVVAVSECVKQPLTNWILEGFLRCRQDPAIPRCGCFGPVSLELGIIRAHVNANVKRPILPVIKSNSYSWLSLKCRGFHPYRPLVCPQWQRLEPDSRSKADGRLFPFNRFVTWKVSVVQELHNSFVEQDYDSLGSAQ